MFDEYKFFDGLTKIYKETVSVKLSSLIIKDFAVECTGPENYKKKLFVSVHRYLCNTNLKVGYPLIISKRLPM